MAYRRRRFGHPRASKGPVSRSLLTQRKKGRCAACKQELPAGTTVVVLRLRKAWKAPCVSCHVKPRASRRYHEVCVPSDINAAMGIDPSRVTPPTPSYSSGNAVPPPPKPMTAHESMLAALLAMETAFKRRLAEHPELQSSEDLKNALAKYNGCKGHILRPGSDQEAQSGAKLALKRVLDLVF